MKGDEHLDLSSIHDNFDDVYHQLKSEQNDGLSRYARAQTFFYLAIFLTPVAFAISPFYAIVSGCIAAVAIEREIWWGREISNRNYLLHWLTLRDIPGRNTDKSQDQGYAQVPEDRDL